jgi:hypothetical protein
MAALDLARLVVRLEAQSAQLLTELERANTKVEQFASKTQKTLVKWAGGLAAAFSVQALKAYAKSVIDAGDDLNDMAQKAGASVKVLSQLGYAAKENGSDIEGVTTGLVKLANNMQAASDGSAQQISAFKALGVEYENADGTLRSTDEVFKDIAESSSKYRDGAGKTAVAIDLLGKSGADLIPTLNLGRQGLEDLADESDRVGATIDDKTAQALGDFNDQLDKLTLSAQGVVAAGLAPVLKDISSALSDATTNGEGFSRMTSALEFTFRVLADIGYSVYKTFDDIGKSLGALGAAAVAAAHGNFAQARDIMKMSSEDQKKSEEDANKFLSKLWGDRTDTIKKSTDRAQELIAEADAALKKSLVYGQYKDPVQDVTITGATKIKKGAMEELNDELDELTQTQEEKAIASFDKQKAALDDIWNSGAMSAEEYNARLKEMQDDLLPQIDVTVKKIQEIAVKANEYEIEAARNTQDIIADTLESIATDGDVTAESILKSFGQMIVKLAAQAVAADIAGKLFGNAAGGKGGGLLGQAATFVSGYFGMGGSKDSGGRGKPGVSYSIGTGAQPETFIPDTPGTFVPAGMGGNTSNNFNFNLKTEQPVSRRTEEQVAAAAFRGISRANRRNN